MFSYKFEVACMVQPTLELTDDYINFPGHSFYRMAFLVIVRWFPQFIVYTIDTSIWYALWQAFAGTVVGFRENLGDVKDFKDIRRSFTKMPEAFCTKVIAPNDELGIGSSSNMLNRSSTNMLSGREAGGARKAVDETTSLLSSNKAGGSGGTGGGTFRKTFKDATARLLDVRIQKWVVFSEAWNEIIDHFRDEDIISNR